MLRPRSSFALVAAALGLAAHGSALAQPRCDAPAVLLAVDKSSSMLGALPAGGTKWDAARTAIGEITTAFESNIDFGLSVFPHAGECSAGQVDLTIGERTSAEIVAALGAPPPTAGNWTPIAQTLDTLGMYGGLLDTSRARHLVLITDGWQWCSPYDPATRFTPVDAVARLRAAGITVHVIGFGDGVDSLTLNRAAVAAATDLPGCDATLSDPGADNHCYLQVDDLSELREALDSVARLVTEEVCDGYDNDCDGSVDEGFDQDADGYTTCGTVPMMPGVTTRERADCDDTRAAVHPGAEEICDGLDNDCDGMADTGCGCMPGATRPCGTDVGACSPGTQTCMAGTWMECAGGRGAAGAEACDGIDEDCDGVVDDGATCPSGYACMRGMCVDLTPDPPPTMDPTPEDVPPTDSRIAVEEDGGCGCVAAGLPAGRGRSAWLALGALAGLCVRVLRRRRRTG